MPRLEGCPGEGEGHTEGDPTWCQQKGHALPGGDETGHSVQNHPDVDVDAGELHSKVYVRGKKRRNWREKRVNSFGGAAAGGKQETMCLGMAPPA
ncbi:hypothetical protein KQX54_000275 [Cotesia glomerata]|uniref:Uncharacterized protein n=1 Tax=Cotesia glomerata TaxID=32391 RepID=A0AAV7HUY8_COTGL|nr:hypothetical protein KQX54_000275 [Cotesia glomerata]